MLDSKTRIEIALRGAKIAKTALSLLDERGDALTLRLTCRELAEQVLDLERVSATVTGAVR